MGGRMDANQYVLVHGMRRTRSILESWGDDPWPVLRTWLLGALLIAFALLGGVTITASLAKPDYGFHYRAHRSRGPGPARRPRGPGPELPGAGPPRVRLRRRLHRRRHAAADREHQDGYQAADPREGPSNRVRVGDRGDLLSLLTQTLGLGLVGATIAWDEHISAPLLVLTALPHALLELTAVFLPLAAWTIASRRGEWDQLLAATFVTVAMAIPMLIVAATWESLRGRRSSTPSHRADPSCADLRVELGRGLGVAEVPVEVHVEELVAERGRAQVAAARHRLLRVGGVDQTRRRERGIA